MHHQQDTTSTGILLTCIILSYKYINHAVFFSFHSLGSNNALFTGDMEKNDTEQQEEVSFVQ